MKKFILLNICFLFFFGVTVTHLFSQTLISTAAKKDQTSRLAIDWTVGESNIISSYSKNGILTQGFHQPVLTISEPENKNEVGNPSLNKSNVGMTLSIYPNPTSSILYLNNKNKIHEKLYLTIYNSNGQELESIFLNEEFDSQLIDMSNKNPGSYFISIRDKNGKVVKTYNINKI